MIFLFEIQIHRTLQTQSFDANVFNCSIEVITEPFSMIF